MTKNICPIMSRQTKWEDKVACYEGKCAWYDEENKCCFIETMTLHK